MLQQTQVSRVIDRFNQFIDRFPTVSDLAAAPEQDVLALWSGLGYYRRARLLHAAAKAVVEKFDARFPSDPAVLVALPGVGRYTAGAIASMALGERAPVVDGNVVRVLLRLDGARGLPPGAARTGDKRAEEWSWRRAATLIEQAKHPGALNEGLMELGALVCVPGAPHCSRCPLANICIARAEGTQQAIPAPKKLPARKKLYCSSVFVRDHQGRVAMERRSARGMWAGLWQVPTLERADRPASADELQAWLAPDVLPARRSVIAPRASFQHITTHRDVFFDVWECISGSPGQRGVNPSQPSWSWVAPPEAALLGISSAQQRVLALFDQETNQPRLSHQFPNTLK